MKYQETKAQCQKRIDEAGTVCDRCGRKPVPIRTVDNAGNPTYWSGCKHGDEDGHFTYGVKKEFFEVAEKLVQNGETYYKHLSKAEWDESEWHRLYWFQSQVSGLANLLSHAEYLKTHDPKKTKKEFLEDEYF